MIEVQLTTRDIEIFRFIAKYRVCTADQLIRVGLFKNRKKCLNRLLLLAKAGYLRSGKLPNRQLFYSLTAKAGEAAGIEKPYYSSFYRSVSVNTIIHQLIACDFALAVGAEYLSKEEVFKELKDADYSTLIKVFKSNDRFFVRGERLSVLVIDNMLSTKYLCERIKMYSSLPANVRDRLEVTVLVFSDSKKVQVSRVGAGVKLRVVKTNFKYDR